ncbi:MAG: toll/interleukin-1 receptor domain-containing protein [Candidatus Delongbacteria bacterium]|nr:toll/interleukin-1 receptor domain-containing protein [Candidatus Delongbacteria bacterium]
MVTEKNYDFFICHASEDKNRIAIPLYYYLKNCKYNVWFDNSDIHIGNELNETIVNGLKNSKSFIVILSPAFFSSIKTWTIKELNEIKQMVLIGKKVFPIYHNMQPNEIFDENYKWILNYHGISFNSGMYDVLKNLFATIDNSKDSQIRIPINDLFYIYKGLCNKNAYFEELCSNIIYKKALSQINIADISKNVTQKEIRNFIYCLHKVLYVSHFQLFFQLTLFLYDKINASKKMDDIYIEIFNVLDSKIILKEYILPEKASKYLCKTFIEEIEKVNYDFPPHLLYTTCLRSKKFVEYLLFIDKYFLYQYIPFWVKKEKESTTGELLDIISIVHKRDPENQVSKRLEHYASDIAYKNELETFYDNTESETYKYLFFMIKKYRRN